MKRELLFIAVIVFGSLLISSCSTPADNWSCSKLKSEIKRCEKNIYASKYNYENGAMTYERYRENVKAFEDAIKHYRKKLQTCKDKPLSIQINTTKRVNKKNKETELINNKVEIEGSWSSIEAREYGILKTTFEKRELDNKYMEISNLIDGGKHIGRLELNNRGEYHTNNKFGEYYKFIGSSLGCYDRDGLIYSLYQPM